MLKSRINQKNKPIFEPFITEDSDLLLKDNK